MINAITMYRLIAAPVLVILLLCRQEEIYRWLLLVSFSTDMIDGRLARKYKVASVFGAKIDSVADDLTVAAGITGLLLLKPEFLKQQFWYLMPILALFAIQTILALYKYGKFTSFHSYAAKLAALLQGVFLILAFFMSTPPLFLFYIAVLVTALDLLEEIILVLLLPVWKTDVKGLCWILRSRNRQ